jgi:hypothetical protein
MRELFGNKGNFVPTPTVKLTEKVGCTFKGKLLEEKETKFGKAYIFAILDGDAPIKVATDKVEMIEGEERKVYEDVDVKVGDKVFLSPGTQLRSKLADAKIGETIEITYLGKKLNKESGYKFGDYKAVVIE